MIGSGIFALPSQMAVSAAPGPLLIGWAITGVGMLTLAFVFQTLATRKPDVDGGVYGYARAGFGNYIGFTSAFGYWVSAWVGNVAYLVLLFSTLGYFFPQFEGGATVPAIIGASVVLWIVHAMTLRGVQTAAFVNVVVTIAKVVPILVFIAIAAVGFKAGLFSADFWGRTTKIDGASLGDTMTQVKTMMLVTVWVFIGIEGARLFAARHQAQGCRPGHSAWLRRGIGAAADGQLVVVRLDGAGATGRGAGPVDGRGAGERGRQLGRGLHLDRPGRLAARRPHRMGAAVRGDPAPARP
jgi:amino acid transporter